MSKLQHIKVNETENRTKLQQIISSEIQDQVTQHVTWITTKQKTTLQHIHRNEVKHRTKLHDIKQKIRLICTAFISNIIRYGEYLMKC